MAEILEPRADELCELMRDQLRQAGVLELCNAGLVLTGGGSRMNGLDDVFEKVLERPVRLASPAPLGRMPEVLCEPEFATVVGLAMYAHRTTVTRMIQEQAGFGAKVRTFFARLGA